MAKWWPGGNSSRLGKPSCEFWAVGGVQGEEQLRSVRTELRGSIMTLNHELRKAKEKCDTLQDHMVGRKQMGRCRNIYVYIYTYTHSYIYVYIHIHVYVCMYICIYVYMCICIYVCIYICTYMYIHIYLCVYICIHMIDLCVCTTTDATRVRWVKEHTAAESVRLQARVAEAEEQLGCAGQESPGEAGRVIAELRAEVEEVEEEKRRLREELSRQQEESDFLAGELRRVKMTSSSSPSGGGEAAREAAEKERKRLVRGGGGSYGVQGVGCRM